ncbi:putative membrane protein [Mycobacterium avium MAV_120709_2344]|nr:putative membrane protein [Mycobacterium avium MAV_120709_2344]ETZ42841.1 putative membrane protein [Mycobacterium avium MAV_120709_2344]ETZ58192.1 putative membrane protein [Mycobacterium avium MAV_120709_2344]
MLTRIRLALLVTALTLTMTGCTPLVSLSGFQPCGHSIGGVC